MLQNRFKKILVPLDGSKNSIRGLNEAISLARESKGVITGVYVMQSFSPKVAQVLKSYRAKLSDDAQKIMSHARTSAARHGLDFIEQVTASTDIVKTITGYAKKNKFDVIVMGSRGSGAPEAPYLGSVANGVINITRVPVLVVK